MTNTINKKKYTFEDRFARKYYCKKARLNSIRADKKLATSKFRAITKKVDYD